MRHYLSALLFLLGLTQTNPLQAGPIQLPDGQVLPRVDFERHVQAILDRQSCNAGACHGSSRGHGGFTLSLMAESPEQDHRALTRGSRGRRLLINAPEHSLLLRRPLGYDGHEGGRKLDEKSWEFQVLRQWIADGAPWQRDSGKIARLEVEPREISFTDLEQTKQLKVFVCYADGSRHDMTLFSDFRLPDDRVAHVSSTGKVTSTGRGMDTVVAFHRGHVAAVPVWVAGPRLKKYPHVPEVNVIDRDIFGKLRELNLVPAELSSDIEFLRRAMIDVTGTLPTPDEIRVFLASKDPEKRSRKIEELLASPRRATLWAVRFWAATAFRSDGTNTVEGWLPGWNQMWLDWFRVRFEKNESLGRIAEDVLLATTREGRSSTEALAEAERLVRESRSGFRTAYSQRKTLDLFWRVSWQGVPKQDWAERIAAAFLGIRLECAQCHRHPLGPWTREDHRAFANVFQQVKVDVAPDVRDLAQCHIQQRVLLRNAAPAAAREQEQFNIGLWQRVFREVRVGEAATPEESARILGGPAVDLGSDPRQQFVRWLLARDNPYFARSIVNRVWATYFGIGLVEPFDSFSAGNPPSHPRLLEALARDFVASNYDLRRLERTILQSRTYQLSGQPHVPGQPNSRLFAYSFPRRIDGRVFFDLLSDAADSVPNLGPNAPAGMRSAEMAANHPVAGYLRTDNGWEEREALMVRLFGREKLIARCGDGWTPRSYLHIMSSSPITELFKKSARVRALAASKKTNDEITEELFLATLSRFPTAKELGMVQEHFVSRKTARERLEMIENILWALTNTTEFLIRK